MSYDFKNKALDIFLDLRVRKGKTIATAKYVYEIDEAVKIIMTELKAAYTAGEQEERFRWMEGMTRGEKK